MKTVVEEKKRRSEIDMNRDDNPIQTRVHEDYLKLSDGLTHEIEVRYRFAVLLLVRRSGIRAFVDLMVSAQHATIWITCQTVES